MKMMTTAAVVERLKKTKNVARIDVRFLRLHKLYRPVTFGLALRGFPELQLPHYAVHQWDYDMARFNVFELGIRSYTRRLRDCPHCGTLYYDTAAKDYDVRFANNVKTWPNEIREMLELSISNKTQVSKYGGTNGPSWTIRLCLKTIIPEIVQETLLTLERKKYPFVAVVQEADWAEARVELRGDPLLVAMDTEGNFWLLAAFHLSNGEHYVASEFTGKV